MDGKSEKTNTVRKCGYLNEFEKPVKIWKDLLQYLSAYLQIYFSV